MKYFFDRLKEERKRLGLNQDDFAALGGVKKGAQFNYENGSRTPDSDYLAAIAKAGVDVLYLLTGAHAATSLAVDEGELLDCYRQLDVRGKAGVLGMIGGMRLPAPPVPASIAPHVEMHGKIGQHVIGNITGSQTINMGNSKKKEK